MHRNLMRTFRLYMLVGGMPQSIETYIFIRQQVVKDVE